MLWKKSWLDTRWRFVLGLALLVVLACGTVFDYRVVLQLRPIVQHSLVALDRNAAPSSGVGRALEEAIEIQRTYRGFIWYQWFRQNLGQTLTLLAVLLGSGGLLSGGSALFTMSLPVPRRRVLGSRAAVALGELFVLAFVPTLAIALLSPSIGQHYSLVDAVVHSACAFVGAAVFLFAALLLSTEFPDLWRPLLITCVAAVALALVGRVAPTLARVDMFGAIVAEPYFRSGTLPWPALVVSVVASAVLFRAATINFARQEF
jgi:hypothetical protein